MSNLDWLWKEEAPEEGGIKVPEGGQFVTGFAGEFTVGPYYKIWVEESLADVSILEENGIEPDAFNRLRNGGSVYWLPKNHQKAIDGAKAAGLQFGPRPVLRWEMPTVTMLNFSGDSAAETFGDTIAFDINLSSMFGGSRHEYHMLFLPSLVQELAMTSGMITERLYDYEGLEMDGTRVDDEYQTRMIGTDKQYEESELWQARVKIWQALGENDPRNYTVNQGGKSDVESKQLAACLSITSRPKTVMWARVARVANPKVPAPDKQNYGVYVVCRIWKNKEDAVAEMGEQEGATATADESGMPALPEAWAGATASDWISWLKEWLAQFEGKPRPVLLKEIKKQDKQLKSEFACSADDVILWLDHVA